MNRFVSGSWAFGDSPLAFVEMVQFAVAVRHTVNCDVQFLSVAPLYEHT